MMIKTTILITLILFNVTAFTQTFNGVVLNKESKTPISYVSIGIIDKPYGTYSSEYGLFNLQLREYEEMDSLRISCVGYESISYSIKDLLFSDKYNLDTIYLKEKTIILDEVVVFANNFIEEDIGNKKSTQQLRIGFFGDREKGIVIKNDKKIFLNKVSFKLTMAGKVVPDSAIFRFNIYNLKDNLPNENILKQPIYFHLNDNQFYGTNEFDLSEYGIVITTDFAATFELIRQYGGSTIYFAAWIKGCPSIYRKGKQGKWMTVLTDRGNRSIYQSLKINVSYEKE